MAVVSVNEVKAEDAGEAGVEGVVNRAWVVTTNSNTDSLVDVATDSAVTAQIPSYGTGHPDNGIYTARNASWDRPTARHWMVRVPYLNTPLSEEEREKATVPNPLNRKARVSKSSAEFQVYRWKDLAGEPYRNSAGHPLQVTAYEETRAVYTIKMNVFGIDLAWAEYENTVNETACSFTDGVTTWQPRKRQQLIKRITHSELQEENSIQFYEAVCEVHIDGRRLSEIDNDTNKYWKEERLDIGFFIRENDEDKRITVKDNSGNDQDSPIEHLLDGSGGLLADGADPVFLEFDKFWEREHKDLPFFS